MMIRTGVFSKLVTGASVTALAVASLAMAQPADASVMVDNSANSAKYGYAPNNPITQTIDDFTVANNANRMLLVSIGGEQVGDIDSVTYGGTNLTQRIKTQTNFATDGSNDVSAIYYLTNPDAGTQDISVTLNATPNDTANFQIGAVSFYNAAQEAPAQAQGDAYRHPGDSTDSSTASLDIQATDGGAIFEVLETNGDTDNGVSFTAQSGQTVYYSDVTNTSGGFSSAGGYELVNADGTQTQSWDYNFKNDHSFSAVSINAVPEPASLAVLGVGSVLLGMRRRRRA